MSLLVNFRVLWGHAFSETRARILQGKVKYFTNYNKTDSFQNNLFIIYYLEWQHVSTLQSHHQAFIVN
jgi:hypothetical protein